MGNHEYMRRIVDQLCLHTDDIIPDIPIGGITPAAEFFGATAQDGTSNVAADAEHRHEMPDASDFLDNKAFFFDHVAWNDPTGIYFNLPAGGAVGGRDDVGAYGAFGSIDATSPVALNQSCYIYLKNTAATDISTAVHLWQRVQSLIIRAMPADTFAQLASLSCAVGALRCSANGTGTNVITNIIDGVYFQVDTDALGVGKWQAKAMNNTSVTTVDTGVSPVTDGSDVGFQKFEIQYDHATTTASYLIDDVQVATISTNIPPSTRKLAGFGIFLTNRTAVARTISLDMVIYDGQLVAPT